jgi:hypothetical protein
LASLFPNFVANDRVSPVGLTGTKAPSDEMICDLVFTEPLYLHQLAVMALIVHKVNTSYLLVTNNCYHYTGTIMKLLERGHRITNTVDGANAGKWCGINILGTQDSERKFSSLLERVNDSIKEFVGFISMPHI